MNEIANLLRLADIVTVNNFKVDFILYEDANTIVLFDCNEQVLAILPEDNSDVLIHVYIRGLNAEGLLYDFDLKQEFLGVSKFEEKTL